MARLLIVDGYNVIKASNELRILPLSNARDKLKIKLAGYAGRAGVDVVIVYDAHLQSTARCVLYERGVIVVYTARNETADAYIERVVRTLNMEKSRVAVATSDGMIQTLVMKYAIRISSRELLLEIDSTRQITSNRQHGVVDRRNEAISSSRVLFERLQQDTNIEDK